MTTEIGHGFRQVQDLKFGAVREDRILGLHLFGSNLFSCEAMPIALPIGSFRCTEMLIRPRRFWYIRCGLHGFSIPVPPNESSTATDMK